MGSKGKPADLSVEKVVKRFMKEVKRILGNKAVAVVAFGSRVWGGYKNKSDYDLIVIHRTSQREAEEAAAEASLIASAELRVGIEPIALSLCEYKDNSRYLVARCKKNGLTFYFNGGETEAKRNEAVDMLMLAEEFLEVSKLLLRFKMYRGVVDEAYNTAELAVKALMLWDGYDIPGSHGGVVGEFGRLYVITGRMDRSLGRLLSISLVKRNRARYDARAEIKEEDAKTVLRAAEEFIKIAKQRIK